MAESKLFQVIDKAAKLGKFGDNYKLVSLVPSNFQGEDHFASDVVFAEVKLQNCSTEKSVHVVIKKQVEELLKRKKMYSDGQFYNEVLMYNEILPSLEKNEIVSNVFPKFIYGRATLGDSYEDDIVVLEDLRQDGYRLTREKLFLDFNHCKLVLKKLAKFHALSYVKKRENLEEFYKLVKLLRETKYIEAKKNDVNNFWRFSALRGIENFEKETDEFKTNLENMKKSFEDLYTMMQTLCQPEEPVAVLCHGDLCRNNMLFRYDIDGNPVDVRFFDVATARYASPAIDLSFFLLMNTTTELRREHWHDLFDVYHEALSTAITPKCSVPRLEDIKQEVGAKALYGYTLCSFFIPMMMDEKSLDPRDSAHVTLEEIEAFAKSRGGEPVAKIITDIVRDLVMLICL